MSKINKTDLFLTICSLGMLIPFPLFGATDSFTEDCRALTRDNHRLTGTPEYARAAEYVKKRLQEIGVDRLITQPFATAQTDIARCELQFAEKQKSLPLLPMRPNGVITASAPAEGITGVLRHVVPRTKKGFNSVSLQGAIAVFDYNAGRDWLRALRLGASAVVFVRTGNPEAQNAHHVEVACNLPRFYYDGNSEDLTEGARATIYSEIPWRGAVGQNIFAFLKGTDPVFSQEKEEVILLGAHLDTYGEVPHLTPGAREAANCAGLLKLARYFKKNRPRRHILFAFFDCQARGHAGSSAFYRILETDNKDVSLEERQKSHDEEMTFMNELIELVHASDPLEQESGVRRQMLDRLQDRATEHAYQISDRMYKLRAERNRIRYREENGGEELPEKNRNRVDEIDRMLTEDLRPVKDDWNQLRRVIGHLRRALTVGEAEKLSPGVAEKLEIVLAEVKKNLALRMDELAVGEKRLKAETVLGELIGNHWLALHISLLLGDTTSRWGVIIGGDSDMHSAKDNPGLYGKIQATFLRAAESIPEATSKPSNFVMASADQTLAQTRVIWAAPFLIHSGEIAGMYGIYNIGLGTCQEGLPREGTPGDTLEKINLDAIERQLDDIALMLAPPPQFPDTENLPPTNTPSAKTANPVRLSKEVIASGVANQAGLSLRRGIVADKEYVIPKFSGEKVTGPMVMGLLPGSSIPNTPMPGAIIQFRLKGINALTFVSPKHYAFDNFRLLRTNRNGVYSIGPVTGGAQWWAVNRGGVAFVFDDAGRVTHVSDTNSYDQIRYRLNIFRTNAGALVLPPQVRTEKLPSDAMTILSARGNAELRKNKSYTETADGVVSWYSEEREKGIKLFNLKQLTVLGNGPENLSAEKEDTTVSTGIGFPVKTKWESLLPTGRSAADLWRLNESRLDILRKKNILDSSLAELHGRAEDILLEAVEETTPGRREGLGANGFFCSQPVYNKIRSMLDDLVLAVLILLGLSVPFAFAVERVLVGAVTIYKQLAWFATFFAITFVILYFSHPAFAIANTPVIIFLGFAIVVMSSVVIFIIMRKFEVELNTLQGMTSTVHASDVSQINTFMAATHMGISTMRRRPMRTLLTAITIILLTFTILCFASFGTKSGIVKLFSAPNPTYSGVSIHDVNWSTLGPEIGDVLRARWPNQAHLYRRLWISPETQDNPGLLLSRKNGTQPLTVRGVLGLDPGELLRRDDLKQHFAGLNNQTVFITEAVARSLEIASGDTVLLKGIPLTVGKLVNSVSASAIKDMDTSSILPADFVETASTQESQEATEENLLVQRNWASLPIDSVAIVSADTAEKLGADLRGLMLYTDNVNTSVEIAENIARMLPLPIVATRTNGVYRHVLGTVLSASGIRDLFFPILLGGLVIFGTMLGSVADREKEIYTFSALGLAPKHVATLFFAESMVYSLLGGMGGYLLAQGTVKILTVMSEYGLVRVPEMNMSSTNTIFTILVVMLTVLISAIYPAIKASQSANPGLLRAWRAPEAEGDILDLVFPFTVSEYDITGVVSFLKEHFGNHSDTGLGHFMTENVCLAQEDSGALGLDATIALAPFDLGVSQNFQLRSTPSEIEGIDEVRIILRRRSGQPKDWRRLNKVFLDDLRQQFLIWRSIPHETMESYREQTLTALGRVNGNDAPSEDS